MSVAQLLILSGQIGWTGKCAAALSDLAKNKRSLKKLKQEWHEYLNKLARYVKGDLDDIERSKLTSLITIEVHARDVIDKLKTASKNKLSLNSFEWSSQLRFYFDKPQGDFGKCVVKQTNTTFNYGYEYIESGRLVITPLTDRCYMTLTTALHLARGGSPQGPAGTGMSLIRKHHSVRLAYFTPSYFCSSIRNSSKLNSHLFFFFFTFIYICIVSSLPFLCIQSYSFSPFLGKTETVKDLAKALGKLCIVSNWYVHSHLPSTPLSSHPTVINHHQACPLTLQQCEAMRNYRLLCCFAALHSIVFTLILIFVNIILAISFGICVFLFYSLSLLF
jgi:hypothetical protein